MDLITQLKMGVLAHLAVAGSSVVLYEMSNDLVRALAELVIERKIRDETDEQGRLVLTITRLGLEEAKP